MSFPTSTPIRSTPSHSLIQDHPLPSSSRHPSQRLSRSPKRVKSTPSPTELTSSTSSSASTSSIKPRHRRHASRNATGVRETPIDRPSMSTPWIHASAGEGSTGRQSTSQHRRREMSVPLLSQTLSTFSLSHSPTSPPPSAHTLGYPCRIPASIPFHIPSPMSSTTSRPRTKISTSNPLQDPLPREHTHPSTEPLPYIPSFLGSPFSTKTNRGRYTYSPHSAPPFAGSVGVSDLGSQQAFSPIGGWIEQSEWMVEDVLYQDDAYGLSPVSVEYGRNTSGLSEIASRPRRDTSGSTSSMDDFSGSATSSTSLHSLSRSSGEHYASPNLVTIWPEHDRFDAGEETEPETPSRSLFPQSEGMVEDAIRMSAIPLASPGTSPSVGRSGNLKSTTDREISPLQAYLMARTPSGPSPLNDATAGSTFKPRSPMGFIPRLLSSNKASKKLRTVSPSWQPCEPQPKKIVIEDTRHSVVSPIVIDHGTQDKSSSLEHSVPYRPTDPHSKFSVPRTAHFSQSFSSESSEDLSPSKPPAPLHSSSSTAGTNTSASPISAARASLLARRKTVSGNTKKHTLRTSIRHSAGRPNLRRGVTEPQGPNNASLPGLHSPLGAGVSTPVSALFGDVKPSPAAFASTGLVKKRSKIPGLEIPKFGDSEPSKRSEKSFQGQPIKSRLALMTTASVSRSDHDTKNSSGRGSDGNVSANVKAAQKSRGLRRKTSTMFGTGSSGSIMDACSPIASPLTPTKPGGMGTSAFGLCVSTPSPTTPTHVTYPFVPATSYNSLASPVKGELAASGEAATASSPLERITRSSRASMLRNRPIARASNPMLAATFRAQGRDLRGQSSIHAGRFNSEFVIVQSLGRGEFSQVWKVREKTTGNVFAMKAGRTYTGYKNRLRQLEEVSILHQLSQKQHPHIIPFVDSWEHNERLYIRTAIAPCGDLSTFLLSLAERGGMGEARVWKSLHELCSGLSYVHENNFLHLDIKPSNILITAAGSLQIADFGMSTVITPLGAIGGVSPALPTAIDGEFVWEDGQPNVLVPSPIVDREIEGDREYLCPEALGDGPIGTEADVFSLGILILEAALNVVLPSNGEGWVKLRNDDFSDLEEQYQVRGREDGMAKSKGDDSVMPIVSDVLIRLIKRMMASDPAARVSLANVQASEPMKRLGQLGTVKPALVEENEEFVECLVGCCTL